MSLIAYLFLLNLFVCLHACNSRPLGLFDMKTEKELSSITPTAEFEGGIKSLESFDDVNNEKLRKEPSKDKGINIIGTMEEQFPDDDETKTKEWKKEARSTMESKKQDTKEEVKSKVEDKIVEDVVVMDYAQPHRKPPIHN